MGTLGEGGRGCFKYLGPCYLHGGCERSSGSGSGLAQAWLSLPFGEPADTFLYVCFYLSAFQINKDLKHKRSKSFFGLRALQEQVAGYMWPLGSGLLTPDIYVRPQLN